MTCNQKLPSFSAVEIIISVAVIAFVVITIAGTIIGATTGPASTAEQTQAAELLNEGFTAVKAIRDNDFALLLAGSHGLQNNGNQWELNGSSDSIEGFTRTVSITNIDANTKEVTVDISWTPQLGGPKSISSSQVITNYLRTVAINPPTGTPVDWSTPQIVGRGNTTGNNDGRDVRINGNYAYVINSGGNNDFTVFDISDITNPTSIATLNVANNAARMAYSNDYVYISSSDNNNEITVVNVSSPSNPNIATTINLPRNANVNGLSIRDNYLYATRSRDTGNGADEFIVIDIANPSSPNIVGGVNLNQTVFDVTLVGNYAYLSSANNAAEGYIINVTNPTNPTTAGTINLSGNNDGYTVGATSTHLFLARLNSNVHVFSLSNPTNPQEVAVFDAAGRVERIMFDPTSTYAFMPNSQNYNMDFEVVDISTITSPVQIDHLNTNGIQYSMDFDPSRNLITLVGNADNEELLLISDKVVLAPGEDLCRVNYNIGSQWATGFTVTVVVNNISSSDISSWQIAWGFDGNQNIINYWNANISQSGQNVIGENLTYNSTIPAGGNQSFGFQATYSGTNGPITSDQFTVNGIQCVN